MKSTNSRIDWSGMACVTALFVAARLLYAWLGVTFDASTFPGYMQFIDRELLSSRLLESLWYYHANPPMLNLLAGVGLKLFGAQAPWFYGVVFHALGLLLAFSVYALVRRLSGSRAAAYATCGLLVFSPSFILYENWFLYSFPAAALLTVAALLLERYVRTGATRWALLFFFTLAALLLTRSIFHILWMVMVVGLLTAAMWDRRKQVLLCAALPVLLVGLWYGKNAYLFGTFSSSSWFGLGFSNISTLVMTREELQPLVQKGELSEFALVSRYAQMNRLFNPQQLPPTGIPVLDQVRKSSGEYNFNNRQLLAIDRLYTADGLKVVRTFPAAYVIGLIISNRLFFSPTDMNLYFSAANRQAVAPLDRLYNPLVNGVPASPGMVQQPNFGFTGRAFLEVNTSIPLIFAWCVLLGYGYMQLRTALLEPQTSDRPRAIVLGFIVFTALYIYAVGTAFELAENYRYRWLVEPLMFVLAGVAVTHLLRKLRPKFAPAEPAAAVRPEATADVEPRSIGATAARTEASIGSGFTDALSLSNPRLFALALLLAIVPLWFGRYLPMIDMPQHAGQIAALQQIWAGDATFTHLFRVNWFTPYLLGYLLLYALSVVLPITIAVKVVVSLAVICIPLATASLLRAVGADERWKWLAIPCSYSFAFYWGFLSFIVAAPLAFWFLARTVRFTQAPSVRGAVGIATFALLLFFCHVIVLGLASLVALGYIVGTSYRDMRGLLLRMLPYAVPVPLIGLWMVGTYSTEAAAQNGPWVYGEGFERVLQLLAQPSGREAVVPMTLLVTGSIALLPWLAGSTFNRRPQRWLPFALALLVFIAAPSFVFGSGFFYERLGIFLAPLWLMAWDAPQRATRRLDWAAMVVVLVWAFANAGRFASFARETQTFDAAMASVEPGRRVGSMIFDNRSPLFATPVYLNFPSWYQATGRGVVDFNFAEFYSQMARYRADAGPRMSGTMAWFPTRFEWAAQSGASYDYFLVKADPDVSAAIFKDKRAAVELVAHHGWWWLYRNKERAADAGAGSVAPSVESAR